jgi:hypothetical protein
VHGGERPQQLLLLVLLQLLVSRLPAVARATVMT